MSWADKYYAKTKRRFFYSIMPISNIPSVLQFGILSHDAVEKRGIIHSDVSLRSVQERRDRKQVPNGLRLHQYANLYMDARNPMMYLRYCVDREELCVFQISIDILDWEEDIVLTDLNAGTEYVRFFSIEEGLENIDFERVFLRNWTSQNNITYLAQKAKKCAELLVPYVVKPEYITSVCVPNRVLYTKVRNILGRSDIIAIETNPDIFFEQG